MSFEFDDDDIDWGAVVQSSDALVNQSLNHSNNNYEPPSCDKPRHNDINTMDVPPGFGRNRRHNQLNSNTNNYQNNNQNNHNTTSNHRNSHYTMNNANNSYNHPQTTSNHVNSSNNHSFQHHSTNHTYCNGNNINNSSSHQNNSNRHSYFNGNNNNNNMNRSYSANNTNTNHVSKYNSNYNNKSFTHSNYNNNPSNPNKYSNNQYQNTYKSNNYNGSNNNHGFKTPSPKRKTTTDIRRKQKQQKLQEFIKSAPFSEDVPNDPLPDKDLVHREIKKHNLKRQRLNVPLMDEETSKMWVYPSNLEIRKYQFEATKQALLTNLLVCLPTGMGKTLIAAVVMYNYYRWYPQGIIVFACPTRALVQQQMKAVYDFLDIPQSKFIDLSGRTAAPKRKVLWKEHRIFFVTPQTLKSDLARTAVPVHRFVCMVVDEAHKAQGEHSFHTMTRDMMATNSNIRVLALSATPGSNQKQIQSLINNLRLSKMIIRYDDDKDIAPYRHETKIETITCALTDSLRDLKDTLLKWVRKELDQLFRFEAIRGYQADTITAWNVLSEMGTFRNTKSSKHNESTKWYCVGRYQCLHGLVMLRERMEHYSVAVMLKKLDEIKDKVFGKHGYSYMNKLLRGSEFNEWTMLCEEQVNMNRFHPKMTQLAQIVMEHFTHCTEANSRVIVFSSLRHSVVDIVSNLGTFNHCKPYQFVGQSSGKSGKGLSNKEQQEVIQDFKSGKYNILVSTCVGEEGLDIGQVDIVIHYDLSSNVLRNVQRSGRTGRKRAGRVVYLCSTQTELRRYSTMQTTKKKIRKINSNKYQYFENPPRMFPHGYNPSLFRTDLEPPAEFITLSVKKLRNRSKRTNSKSLYQPIGTGLLSLTQCVAFQHKFDINERLENRMGEIIEDAIEHCNHIQSEYNVGDIQPSESTRFMVRLFRTIDDEEEMEMKYRQLFPDKQKSKDRMDYWFIDGDNYSAEFEEDPYKDITPKTKIRDARPLFSDGDEGDVDRTPSPKRSKRKKNEVYIVQDDDALGSDYASLMDTDSDDCKILGTAKKKKKKRSTNRSNKKKKKKRTLDDLDNDDHEKHDDIDIDMDPGKKKTKKKKKKKSKSHKKRKEKKDKKKDKAKKNKNKNKEIEISDSGSEILDLTMCDKKENVMKDDTKQNVCELMNNIKDGCVENDIESDHGNRCNEMEESMHYNNDDEQMINEKEAIIKYSDTEENHCDDWMNNLNGECVVNLMENDVESNKMNTSINDGDGIDPHDGDAIDPNDDDDDDIEIIVDPIQTVDDDIDMNDTHECMDNEYKDRLTQVEEEEKQNALFSAPYACFETPGGAIVNINQQKKHHDHLSPDMDGDDSVLFHCSTPKRDDILNDIDELELDENDLIPDDELLAVAESIECNTHNVQTQDRVKMDFANCTENPWNNLNNDEKKEVDEFLDEMMPAPRVDRTQIPKFKSHMETSREIIKLMRIKTSQIDSFRAMQSFWPFDTALKNKLKKVFWEIDRNNAILDEYAQQCSDIIDGKSTYIQSNAMHCNIDNDNKPETRQKEQRNSLPNKHCTPINTDRNNSKNESDMNQIDTNDAPKNQSYNGVSNAKSNNNSNISSSPSVELTSIEHRLSNYTLNDSNHCDPSENKLNDDVMADVFNIPVDDNDMHKDPTDYTQKQCTKPVITTQKADTTNNEFIETTANDNTIQCPLCGSLFDTVRAVGVHIDNDHNESNAPTSHEVQAQTQPVFETPILRHGRRKNKRRLILSAESPSSSTKKHNTKRKRKMSNISEKSEATPAIRISKRRKKRKISDISQNITHSNTTSNNKICDDDDQDQDHISQIRAEDYAQIEAVHSDHGDVSSGHENGDENEHHYDLNDSFINNGTQSSIKTQQLFGYRNILKTPKNALNQLYGKALRSRLSQIQKLETDVCNESHIEEDYEWNGMEGYEDPDDPVLPAWDPSKEGIDYENEVSSSDDDELNIRERMKRPYLEQTQQLIAPPSRSKKRKWSDISENIYNPLNTSLSQRPKRRKLIRNPAVSPFLSQPSITNTCNINISPIHNNNDNTNYNNQNQNKHDITSDLEFLNENQDMFYHEAVEYLPQTSPMMIRTLFKSNKKDKKTEKKRNINVEDSDSDEIPQTYMNLESITWQNIVTRECDKVEDELYDLNDTMDILTPELTPAPCTQMTNDRLMSNEIRIIMDATENQKAAKVNELLRNKYKITPMIRSLDFVQYVIGDSMGVIRKKEKDMVKGEQIMALKRIVHRATDRYKDIIFILHRTKEAPQHRTMGIGAAKKLDKNLQQIALSPRIQLIECVESEQVAETIVYCLKVAAKTNKNNVIGVPLCDELEYNDKDGINEKKLLYLTSLPQIGYSEAIWLLREFEFKIQNIVNCPSRKLAEKVASLAFNERHIFIKTLMTHEWQKGTAEEDEEAFDKYMQESSAVKQRKIMKRTNKSQ